MSNGTCRTPWLDEAVGSVVAAAGRLVHRQRGERGGPRLREELLMLRRACDLIELEHSSVAAELERCGPGEWEGAASAWDWIRHSTRTSGAVASRALAVGRMEHRITDSTEAMLEGRIGFGHLALVASTLEGLAAAGREHHLDEERLLQQAEEHSVGRFSHDCVQARHMADAEAMKGEHRERIRNRRLEFIPCGDGGVAIRALLDEVGGATLRTALEPLARPNGFGDSRTRERRLADALIELASHVLDQGSLPKHHSQRPHLQVTASVETLMGLAGAPAAELEFSTPITAEALRRIACDSSLFRVLVSAESAVLDVGRARRMPSAGTRRAVAARDQHCVWPGCDRRAYWSSFHHVQHWGENGPTELGNVVLCCYRHHELVHEGGWKMVRTDEGVVVVPPAVAPVARARPPDSTTAA